MSSIDFYYIDMSSPCRAARLTASALGVKLNLKKVDMLGKKEHLTPEFLKMNPQHTVPTMDHNGFYLCESRAIQTYLADTYDTEGKLYPKCSKARALIDQRMYFDLGNLYDKFLTSFVPVMFKGATEIPEAKKKALCDALCTLDGFIKSCGGYVAGDHMTIADHTIAATISSMAEAGVNICRYYHVAKWYKKVQTEIPGYAEANGAGAAAFGQFVKSKLAPLGITWNPKVNIDFYHIDVSSPCRSARLTAKALGIDLNLKALDMFGKKEHLTPEFLKMNPQHTVPTMDDNGFYLSESRAIQSYLADKYCTDGKIYPKCPKARALVKQRLDFDLGNLYDKFVKCYVPILFMGATEISKDQKTGIYTALAALDGFINTCGGYVAGKHITIADHSLAATVSSMVECGVPINQYKHLSDWYKRVQVEMPGYAEANQVGATMFGQMVKSKMAAHGITW